MKTTLQILVCSWLALLASPARAADIAGQWCGEFDSQLGQQKYLFTFEVKEGKVTAKATAEARDQKRDVEFKDARLEGDTLTFVEMRTFQDNEVRIGYTGKVTSNGHDATHWRNNLWLFAQRIFNSGASPE